MEKLKILGNIERVKAPAGFEKQVLARIGQEAGKREKGRMLVILRTALAGAAALAVIAIGINVIHKHAGQTLPVETAGIESRAPDYGRYSVPERSGGQGYLPLLETVDYTDEIRGGSPGARTVYILEQVSEGQTSGIKY